MSSSGERLLPPDNDDPSSQNRFPPPDSSEKIKDPIPPLIADSPDVSTPSNVIPAGEFPIPPDDNNDSIPPEDNDDPSPLKADDNDPIPPPPQFQQKCSKQPLALYSRLTLVGFSHLAARLRGRMP